MAKHERIAAWGAVSIALLVLTTAAGSPPPDSAKPPAAKLERLTWLLGSFKREGRSGSIGESWTRLGDRLFEGKSFRSDGSGGAPVPLEDLLLAEMGGELFYISKVEENRYPVAFRLTELGERSATFENPTHDFPQRIRYELREDGTLYAAIEGPGEPGGPPRRIEFRFERD